MKVYFSNYSRKSAGRFRSEHVEGDVDLAGAVEEQPEASAADGGVPRGCGRRAWGEEAEHR